MKDLFTGRVYSGGETRWTTFWPTIPWLCWLLPPLPRRPFHDRILRLGTGRHPVRLRRGGDADHEMRAAPDGWWRVDVPDAGIDYSFLLNDDETPLPDPGRRGSLRECTGRADATTILRSSGLIPRGRAGSCPAASSTSCTSAPSPRKAPSTRPSTASTTWCRWAST
ncbi:hypothetical protein NKG94_12625 [Micromonospora sp. M12]